MAEKIVSQYVEKFKTAYCSGVAIPTVVAAVRLEMQIGVFYFLCQASPELARKSEHGSGIILDVILPGKHITNRRPFHSHFGGAYAKNRTHAALHLFYIHSCSYSTRHCGSTNGTCRSIRGNMVRRLPECAVCA